MVLKHTRLQLAHVSETTLVPLIVNFVITPQKHLLTESNLNFSQVYVQHNGVTLVVIQLLSLANQELGSRHKYHSVLNVLPSLF